MQGYYQRLSAHARILLFLDSRAFHEHNKTGNDSPGKDIELAVTSLIRWQMDTFTFGKFTPGAFSRS